MRRLNWLTWLLPLSAATLISDWPQAQLITTPNGTDYGIVVPKNRSAGVPTPALISLTGAMADTLGCNLTNWPDPCYYANACEFLVADHGWSCISIDLPSHGAQLEAGEPEGIAGWRWRVDRGENFVAQANVHSQVPPRLAKTNRCF